MKNLFIAVMFFSISLLVGGCSSKNAFSNFETTHNQESMLSSLKTTKLIDNDNNVKGVFSCILLNQVYPDFYNDGDYFFIAFYTKNEADANNLELKLNNKDPLEVQHLKKDSSLVRLLDSKNGWTKYQLAKFNTTSLSLELNLKIEDTNTTLKYSKDY